MINRKHYGFYYDKHASIAKNQSTRSMPFTRACFFSLFLSFTAMTSACILLYTWVKYHGSASFMVGFFLFFNMAFCIAIPNVKHQRSHLFRISKYYIDYTLVYIEQLRKEAFSKFSFPKRFLPTQFCLADSSLSCL
jgi:hypothetical protein